ncbi:MAG: 4-hydroxy-3-methylbut-2-enyl diphosphate reductase [Planctomycetota bacterium]|nr:4-hydroxy-3-methylbut-2-enyl diphosphate reductase [Planctomycetota bacterium]
MQDELKLEVIVASSAGTCFGVEAAIEIAENQKKPILGPLVHNPQIVNDLANEGIPILERYEGMQALVEQGLEEVIITAHGYPKQLKEDLTSRGIRFHDATCPVLLKWVYRKMERFEKEGYHIILVGNPEHAEIIASRSYSKCISVVYSEEEINALPDDLGKTVAICQTTITKEKFQRLVNYIRDAKYPDLRAVDTRCKPVKNQQEAVQDLAQWVDAMLVIGGFNSSNTTNLARISSEFLPESTHHIDSPALIQQEWLDGISHLGIAAGTSTPKSQIEDVKARVAEMFKGGVVFRKGNEEDDIMSFESDELVEV